VSGGVVIFGRGVLLRSPWMSLICLGRRLVCSHNNQRQQVFSLRLQNQRQIRHTDFWPIPYLSLAEARKPHEEARGLVLDGIDPRDNSQELLSKPFSHYAQEMMSTQDLRPSTALKKSAKIKRHLFCPLDKKSVDTITAVDLLNLLKPIADSGKRETAKDLTTYCRQTFNHLLALQLIHNNPAATISELLPKPKKSANFAHIADPSQFGDFLKAIDAYQGDYAVKKVLQFASLTMLRP
jgi:hypothetical protein